MELFLSFKLFNQLEPLIIDVLLLFIINLFPEENRCSVI